MLGKALFPCHYHRDIFLQKTNQKSQNNKGQLIASDINF